MFRTASMLWESYNLKHAHGKTQRSKQEESMCLEPLVVQLRVPYTDRG